MAILTNIDLMNYFRFTCYLFYKYYSTGPTQDIPYFSTVCAIVTIIVLHLMQILTLVYIFFHVDLFLPSNANSRVKHYLIIMVVTLPIFLIVHAILRKCKFREMHYDQRQIRRGNINLVIYIVLSVALYF